MFMGKEIHSTEADHGHGSANAVRLDRSRSVRKMYGQSRYVEALMKAPPDDQRSLIEYVDDKWSAIIDRRHYVLAPVAIAGSMIAMVGRIMSPVPMEKPWHIAKAIGWYYAGKRPERMAFISEAKVVEAAKPGEKNKGQEGVAGAH